MRAVWKLVLNGVSLSVVLPAVLFVRAEDLLPGRRDLFFDFFAHSFALIPGLPGVYLRRAYYRGVLEYCAMDCCICFGTVFSRRTARVDSGVYIGMYAVIGSVHLQRDCLVGSRASLLSGGQLHHYEHGKWGPCDFAGETQIHIGEGAWLGEAVVVMSDVGEGALVAAGSVVATPVKARIVVAGNPARFVRRLDSPREVASDHESAVETSSTSGTRP